jgi:Uncharacterized protein conserved in bacteria (DUF2188)
MSKKLNQPSERSYHVIARVGGGWNVKKRGAVRASKSFETQRQAISYARKISITEHAELFIHNENGRLSKKETFSSNPIPMKDIIVS